MGLVDRLLGRSAPPTPDAVRPTATQGLGRLMSLPEDHYMKVVGESHYQDALRVLAQHCVPGVDGRPSFQAAVVPEPDNVHDRHAIAVHGPTGKIGYLARDDAARYASTFDALRRAGYDGGSCTGLLNGGDRDRPSIGVVLMLAYPEVTETRLGVSSGAGTASTTRATPAHQEAGPKTRETRAEVDYANPDEYAIPPVLTLREWDYGEGLDETAAGFGFAAPDGRIWPAGNCKWSTWEELGVLVVNVVGVGYHAEDLDDKSFDPGQPIRLVSEPDNPHDSKAIAVRNWVADRTAGYVKKGSTSRLRNLLEGHDLRVMALSCRYDQPPPRGRRESLKVVLCRPGRLLGADHLPPHPPLE